MTEPDPTGSPDEPPRPALEEPGLVLPSWVDAAITRSKEDRRTPDEAPVPGSPSPTPPPVAEPAFSSPEVLETNPQDLVIESDTAVAEEPAIESDATVPEDLAIESHAAIAPPPPTSGDAVEAEPVGILPPLADNAAPLESAAAAEVAATAPVDEPARRGLALPWLLAALLFAAAAVVMAFMIWGRPQR
jgi:hypothetical protein